MLRLLHISDLHFGPPYIPAVGEAVLRAADELAPEIIVISGDFTQRAKKQQYSAASDFLGTLPRVALVVVPGNHDVPLYRVAERVMKPYALYQRYITQELDYVYRREDSIIVALNTTRPLRAITNGRLDRWQLDMCAEAFQGAPASAARIIVAHHHFAPAPDYENEFDVIPNARAALDRFTQLQVDLILGGHLHRAYIGNSLDVYPGKDRSHGIVIVHAGTATSQRGRAREREKNSINLINISEDEIEIVHYLYFRESGRFEPASRHIFPRRHRRFLDSAPRA